MNAIVFDVALTAYIFAAVAAVWGFFGRAEPLGRVAYLLTQAGWVCHTAAVVIRGVELGRLPFLTLAEMVSLAIWVAVLLDLWIARHYRLTALSTFVLPVVLALGLGLPTGLRHMALEPAAQRGWVVVHVTLVLVGLAALVLNFGAALMYVLQERALKAKRPGPVYYRLPPLETLTRLTAGTLVVGFPFLTVGLALGVVAAERLLPLAGDPLTLFSVLTWVIYAATLWGRALGGWGGRRAAWVDIAGFCVLLVALAAGVIFRGRHGS